MMKFLASLVKLNLLMLFFEGNVNAAKPVTVWIIGDSTASSYESGLSPRTGWGQVFGEFFESDVIVRNEAVSGRSTKSFIDEGRFRRITSEMKSGDYLLIQFGHNDEKNQDPKRYADPQAYGANLSFFAKRARSLGVHPVILTPIERRSFHNGVLQETHGAYPEAARKAAADTDTLCIDINEKSRKLFSSLGEDGTKKLFLILDKGVSPNYPDGIIDNTHLQTEGALTMGKLVIEGLREKSVPLADFVKKQYISSGGGAHALQKK